MCNKQELTRNQIAVFINKEETMLEEGITVQSLLEQRGVKTRSSVWINGRQLLLSEYPNWVIRDGDKIKILRVVAGG